MRILVAAVGRAKAGPARDLFEAYRRRIAWPLELKEVEERRRLSAEEMKGREAELLLGALPKRETRIVALDERGKTLSSTEFADLLGRWRDQGAAEIAFLIGGADGLEPTVTARADLVLSLGRMTWPHLLVRGLLAEQLYRAQQILANHPYHRE